RAPLADVLKRKEWIAQGGIDAKELRPGAVLARPAGRIVVRVDFEGLHRRGNRAHVGAGSRDLGPGLGLQKIRNRNGGKYGDDGYDDQQLNQGETRGKALHWTAPSADRRA